MAVGAALMLHGSGAAALGLLQAYEAALQNDPAYRAARYARDAGAENRIVGRSTLLPSLSGSFNGSKNNSTIGFDGKESPRDYISRSSTVQLRQPLFSLEALARYKQGVAQSDYAQMQYASQSQEVIVRVVNAYLDVLYRKDQLALARAQRDMYAEQRQVNNRLFTKGEGTRTDMLETQARLDLSEAQLLEAQDEVANATSALSGIIGGEVDELDPLAPGFRVQAADQRSFTDWKTLALEQNPDVRALTNAVEIARQEVNKQRSGHAPRLDFVAVYQKSASETINLYNQDTTVRSLGIQLNIPLYNGGAVSALTRQAVANQEKAKADLQTQVDKVSTELRRQYNLVASSVTRIAALEKAVSSGELLTQATQQSIKGGVRINLDLLNAQQQLVSSKRDLAQARYNYLLSSLRLRAAAGILSGEDLRAMAAYFR
nr:TolC family outer membrane protein [Pseudoduganella violacea]